MRQASAGSGKPEVLKVRRTAPWVTSVIYLYMVWSRLLVHNGKHSSGPATYRQSRLSTAPLLTTLRGSGG